MKAVLLHGLGQTARDWRAVMDRIPALEMECLELSSLAEDGAVYSDLLAGLERRCAELPAPFCLCGLSLGAMLALDYAVRHGERVALLILIGAQVRVPTRLVDFQNLVFRCMPKRAFASMGLSKDGAIRLARSMRSLDFSAKLGGIACPAAVVCGERDRANRGAAEELQRLLPNAELRIIPGAGHEVNRDAPEALAALLNEKMA